MEQQYDFSIIERAKLTQREFGAMCNVDRVTVNLWVNRKMSPHRYIRELVSASLTAVGQALADGRLPLPEGVSRDDRPSAIAAALQPVAQEG